MVYFPELKPLSRDELAEIAETFTIQRNLELNPEVQNKLSSMCVGINKDSFNQVLERAMLKRESFNSDVISIAQDAKNSLWIRAGF
jgi:hypothetical protein